MSGNREIVFTLLELKEQLRSRAITQTIRSKTELSRHKWTVGSDVSIKWRTEFVGKGRIILIEPVKIRDLTEIDAKLGGFDSVNELIKALKKFFGRLGEKRFWDAEVNRVRFVWV